MCPDNLLSSIAEDGTYPSHPPTPPPASFPFWLSVKQTTVCRRHMKCRTVQNYVATSLLIVPLVTALPLVQLVTAFNWFQDCIFPCSSPLIFSIVDCRSYDCVLRPTSTTADWSLWPVSFASLSLRTKIFLLIHLGLFCVESLYCFR